MRLAVQPIQQDWSFLTRPIPARTTTSSSLPVSIRDWKRQLPGRWLFEKDTAARRQQQLLGFTEMPMRQIGSGDNPGYDGSGLADVPVSFIPPNPNLHRMADKRQWRSSSDVCTCEVASEHPQWKVTVWKPGAAITR